MGRVTSTDGTPIAYRRQGDGKALLLVGAGIFDHSEYEPLADALSATFAVYLFDRRGRGASGNTLPYAIEREIEDLAAVAALAKVDSGAAPHVFGLSSGGALALEAAASGVDLDRVAVYEVPYCVNPDTQRRWQAYVDELWVTLAEGRRGDALVTSMRFSGASDTQIALARRSPNWPRMEEVAHLLSYEAATTGDGTLPTTRLATITRPTLAMTGGVRADLRHGMAEFPPDFYDLAADAITTHVPTAERVILADQSHIPDPLPTTQVLTTFFPHHQT